MKRKPECHSIGPVAPQTVAAFEIWPPVDSASRPPHTKSERVVSVTASTFPYVPVSSIVHTSLPALDAERPLPNAAITLAFTSWVPHPFVRPPFITDKSENVKSATNVPRCARWSTRIQPRSHPQTRSGVRLTRRKRLASGKNRHNDELRGYPKRLIPVLANLLISSVFLFVYFVL